MLRLRCDEIYGAMTKYDDGDNDGNEDGNDDDTAAARSESDGTIFVQS